MTQLRFSRPSGPICTRKSCAERAALVDIAGHNRDSHQIQFIDEVVQHLTAHGSMPAERLYASPFTDIHVQGPEGVFPSATVDRLFVALDEIDRRAA